MGDVREPMRRRQPLPPADNVPVSEHIRASPPWLARHIHLHGRQVEPVGFAGLPVCLAALVHWRFGGRGAGLQFRVPVVVEGFDLLAQEMATS